MIVLHQKGNGINLEHDGRLFLVSANQCRQGLIGYYVDDLGTIQQVLTGSLYAKLIAKARGEAYDNKC